MYSPNNSVFFYIEYNIKNNFTTKEQGAKDFQMY